MDNDFPKTLRHYDFAIQILTVPLVARCCYRVKDNNDDNDFIIDIIEITKTLRTISMVNNMAVVTSFQANIVAFSILSAFVCLSTITVTTTDAFVNERGK